jgi:amino acid permease
VSTFGVIAILYFVGVMVGHSAGNGMAEGNLHRISLISGGADVLVGVGLVMFTFCCQPNVLEVYSELQTQTVHQMTKIGGVAMGCCTCLYFLAGFFAYVDFGADVKGSVLKNYHLGDNVPLYIAYTCLAVKLTAGHTLCIAPTRDSVLYTLKLGEYHTADPTKRMIISALLSASALLVALFIPSLQLLFGFLGGLCGSLLGFVFPALFAIRAPGWAENSTKWDRIGAWALVVIGAIVFVLGTVASIYESVA